MSRERNWLGREGARKLADAIEAYRAARGYAVTCRVTALGFSSAVREAHYGVASDMVDGLPTRTIDQTTSQRRAA